MDEAFGHQAPFGRGYRAETLLAAARIRREPEPNKYESYAGDQCLSFGASWKPFIEIRQTGLLSIWNKGW